MLLDTDLYKLTMQQAVCQMYPDAMVRYSFFNRGGTKFPADFAKTLRLLIFGGHGLSREDKHALQAACPFLNPVYLDLLAGYRPDGGEIKICEVKDGDLTLEIEGPWYRTILWEVPLMALISSCYFQEQLKYDSSIHDERKEIARERTIAKAKALEALGVKFADFGTRRRYSQEVHEIVVKTLKEYAPNSFVGTSNVMFALKYGLRPIGTQAHEWFMFHAARYGYREANHLGLKRWSDVYDGDLGIALSDTFTTPVFFEAFNMKYAKLFDGVRQDSGDPVDFAQRVIEHYDSLGIDPKSKTIVFSDGLKVEDIERIHKFCEGKIRDSYGIGTNLTNDVGVKPLNMVIKMTGVKVNGRWVPAVKLSDNPGKNTGGDEEVSLCKSMLGIG